MLILLVSTQVDKFVLSFFNEAVPVLNLSALPNYQVYLGYHLWLCDLWENTNKNTNSAKGWCLKMQTVGKCLFFPFFWVSSINLVIAKFGQNHTFCLVFDIGFQIGKVSNYHIFSKNFKTGLRFKENVLRSQTMILSKYWRDIWSIRWINWNQIHITEK